MASFTFIVSCFFMMTSVLALNPRQVTNTITAAPSPTANTVCTNNLNYYINGGNRYYCPGVVDGINGTDISEAYCCVGAIYETGIPSTHWWYNYSTALPSTVITPTTCLQPIPLTAADYDAQASAASPTPTWSASIVLGSDSSSYSYPTATATATSNSTGFTYTGPSFTGAGSKSTTVSMTGFAMVAGAIMASALF